MKSINRHTRLPAIFATTIIILFFSGTALAVDDGARAYWKGREGTQGFSIQYLNLDLQASGSQQFSPGEYVYPGADVEATLMIAGYARNLVLFDRLSTVLFGVASGSLDAAFVTASLPPDMPTPLCSWMSTCMALRR